MNVHELTSMDFEKSGVKDSDSRSDHNNPVSWIHEDGKGRRLLLLARAQRIGVCKPGNAAALPGRHPVRTGRPPSRRFAGKKYAGRPGIHHDHRTESRS